MNLRALEKVARIGCKYDLSFLLYSCWALPSGGFAEGQLALSSPALFPFSCVDWEQSSAGIGMHKLLVMHVALVFECYRGPVNLCRSLDDTLCVLKDTHVLIEPNHCSILNCSM